MQGTRALLALVVVMGVLIVAGTAGLVAVVAHRLAHPVTVRLPAASAVPGMAPLLHEPAGTRITALARQSDTLLAIALAGGGPDRVLVWDLASGRPLTEIRLSP